MQSSSQSHPVFRAGILSCGCTTTAVMCLFVVESTGSQSSFVRVFFFFFHPKIFSEVVQWLTESGDRGAPSDN